MTDRLQFDRRTFLSQLALWPAFVARAARRSLAPPPAESKSALVIVGGTRVDSMLDAGLERLGGFGPLVAGQHVVIKPNATAPQPYPVTTALDLLRHLVRRTQDAGAASVTVADAPSFAGLTAWRVLSRLGYVDLARELGVRIVTIDPTVGSEFVKVTRPTWKRHPFILSSRLVQEAGVVINTAIPKRHHLSDFSCALKNHFGCTADTFRMLAHVQGGAFFDDSIVEFADAVRPELTIVDARKVLTRSGPTVRPGVSEIKEARRLVLSGDPVAIDAWCAELMERMDDSFHKEPRIRAQLDYAERLGLGLADWRRLPVTEIGSDTAGGRQA